MDRNTYRDDDDLDEPATYWWRRGVTLVAGLGVLGLLAWALSGGGGKPPGTPRTTPDSGSMSAAAYPSGQAPSATPSATASATSSASANAAVPGLTSPGISGLPSATASSSSSSAAKKPAANDKSSGTGSAAAAGTSFQRGGPCPSDAVVLSLFGSQSSYPNGQDPKFSLDAVSTAPGMCTLDVSPAQLDLVVMSSGRVIWDSADCARGGQTQQDKLTRGVPVQESFAWNRTITLPGCVTLASSARLGTYTAQVRAGAVTSEALTFRLVH